MKSVHVLAWRKSPTGFQIEYHRSFRVFEAIAREGRLLRDS